MMKKLEDFFYWRRFQRVNRWAQIILALVFLIALNYGANKYYQRIDITQDKRYSLSAETLAYIRQLQTPIQIIIAMTPDAAERDIQQAYDAVKQLAKEYAYAGNQEGREWIQIEFVNVYQQKKRAEELSVRFGLSRDNTIIIASDKGARQIYPGDLYRAEKGMPTAFIGEQVFTAAILDVSSSQRNKIYFLTGHGEMGAEDVNPLRGLSELEALLRQQNYDVDLLDLSEHKAVPDDAHLVVSAAPQAALLPGEEEILQEYLALQNGRMIALLTPTHPHGMENLFYDWGILVDDRVVMDTGKDFQVAGGDFLIRRFAQHPITQNLIDYQVGLLAGLWRPVRLDPGLPEDELLSIQMLSASSESSWAKRNQRHLASVEFDPDHDLQGPISIAMAAERSLGADLGISLPGGRLVVIGNADLVSNKRLYTLGNHVFFLNAVRWCLDQYQALSLPPKKVETFQIILSQKEFYHISLRLAGIPVLVGLLGAGVYWVRRRQ